MATGPSPLLTNGVIFGFPKAFTISGYGGLDGTELSILWTVAARPTSSLPRNQLDAFDAAQHIPVTSPYGVIAAVRPQQLKASATLFWGTCG